MRFWVSQKLAGQIDSILQANEFQARAEFLVPAIEKAVAKEIHKATVILRCAGINPLAREQ